MISAPVYSNYFFLTLFLFGCGSDTPSTPPEEADWTIDLKTCSLLDSSSIEINLHTSFPKGTRIILTFSENRDAAREPYSRQLQDTLIVSDTSIRYYVAPALLPGSLFLDLPRDLQPDSTLKKIEENNLNFQSVYCPESVYCREYMVHFKEIPYSETDSFLVIKKPLEPVFEEVNVKK